MPARGADAPTELPLTEAFDFVVVDAGSAGCIVASRLSENGRYSVLLIEAGASDDSFFPTITMGNINAPTMTVAEKGANVVLFGDNR